MSKGSTQRKADVPRETFRANFDRIFRSQKDKHYDTRTVKDSKVKENNEYG